MHQMTMNGKVWDIVAPKDNWGKNYAHMERQRIIDHDLWQPTKYITKYIEVKDMAQYGTPEYVMNEDGEFCCEHPNVEIEHDIGGDGYTEPGESWGVFCPDCHNEDITDHEVDLILENYWGQDD